MWQRLGTSTIHTITIYKLIFFFLKKNATSCYISFFGFFFLYILFPVDCYPSLRSIFNGNSNFKRLSWYFIFIDYHIHWYLSSSSTAAVATVFCCCFCFCLKKKFIWFWPFFLLFLFLCSSHVYYHWPQWVRRATVAAGIAVMAMDFQASEKNSKNKKCQFLCPLRDFFEWLPWISRLKKKQRISLTVHLFRIAYTFVFTYPKFHIIIRTLRMNWLAIVIVMDMVVRHRVCRSDCWVVLLEVAVVAVAAVVITAVVHHTEVAIHIQAAVV